MFGNCDHYRAKPEVAPEMSFYTFAINYFSLYNKEMPSRRTMKSKKIKKQAYDIENAISRAEGSQSLARFGQNGNDKFREEMRQHDWIHNLGAKKDLKKLINKHYYKYDSKKTYPKASIRQPITFLYPRRNTRKIRH